MKTVLLMVGKTVDKHLVTLMEDYVERTKHYMTFDVEVIPDLKSTKNLSEEVQKEKEGELIVLVKAADKLSALIKCLEEESAGNREFAEAEKTTRAKIEDMGIPEADIFLREFIPAYARTLDEL